VSPRKKSVPADPAVAYSYLRFSSAKQAEGDSTRRQNELRDAWLAKTGVTLDTSLTLRDEGVSAFTGKHRTNPDRHALASFLELVRRGRIRRGSFLIVEALDRLSREDIRPALTLLLNLIEAGVRVVQLLPVEAVYDENVEPMALMMAIMELSRGHSESRMKSERVGGAWREKKRRARAGEAQKPTERMGNGSKVLTRSLPAWVEERGGKLHLIPERAAVVKRIFALAANGYGLTRIVRKLSEDKVPPFCDMVIVQGEDGKPRKKAPDGGRFGSGRWSRPYVYRILSDRRAVGEHQPRGADGKPSEEPIIGYYPPCITEAEWLAAAAGAKERKIKPGRVSAGRVNVFSGLLKNALEGDAYYLERRKEGHFVLINNNASNGQAGHRSFPFDTFEAAVLSMLKEVDPREVMGRDDGPDEVMALSGELAQIESKIAELEEELLRGDVAALARVLGRLESRKGEVAEQLAAARHKAAHPLSEAWGEFHSLTEALAAAPDPDDARLRLRSALRRVVESVWLLVVPRRRDRLAAVQVWFTGDGHRDYLLFNQTARGNQSGRTAGRWWARSLANTGLPALDLRRKADVKRLEADLLALDLDETKY
jgi:DNA invertase Pin-like site-specific DNA recombinase